MKITPEHLEALRVAIAPLDTPASRVPYIERRVPRAGAVEDWDKRYRWDLLWASGVQVGDGKGMPGLPLYAYMTDDHIDTALRSLVRPLSVQ